jgi:hypothetical protein
MKMVSNVALQPGRCKLCGLLVFELGRSGEIGKAENAWKVTLALSDGSTADVTICSGCVKTVDNNLLALWKTTMSGWTDAQGPELAGITSLGVFGVLCAIPYPSEKGLRIA